MWHYLYPDLSTCNWSLPWDVGAVNSISTKLMGLPSTCAMWHYCLPKKLLTFRPRPTGDHTVLFVLRSSLIRHSRAFIFSIWCQLNFLTYPRIEPLFVLTDSRPWEMRPPPWDCKTTAETVRLTVVPWELRGLYTMIQLLVEHPRWLIQWCPSLPYQRLRSAFDLLLIFVL